MKTNVYLQVEPRFNGYWDLDDPRAISSIHVVGTTQKRSKSPRPGVIEVKITLDIPTAAFMPLRPEATVVIPENLILTHPIEVEASDPESET